MFLTFHPVFYVFHESWALIMSENTLRVLAPVLDKSAFAYTNLLRLSTSAPAQIRLAPPHALPVSNYNPPRPQVPMSGTKITTPLEYGSK